MFLYVQFCDDVPFYVGITHDRYNRPLYFGCGHNKLYKQFIVNNSHKSFRVEVIEIPSNLAENSEYAKIKELVSRGYTLTNIYKHDANKSVSTKNVNRTKCKVPKKGLCKHSQVYNGLTTENHLSVNDLNFLL